jgi:hypothetical protein
MILTKEKFAEGTSRNGGWSNEQLKCFGIGKDKEKGWKKEIIGKDFPQEQIEKYLLLKDAHLPPLDDEESSVLLKWFWATTMYYWFNVT